MLHYPMDAALEICYQYVLCFYYVHIMWWQCVLLWSKSSLLNCKIVATISVALRIEYKCSFTNRYNYLVLKLNFYISVCNVYACFGLFLIPCVYREWRVKSFILGMSPCSYVESLVSSSLLYFTFNTNISVAPDFDDIWWYNHNGPFSKYIHNKICIFVNHRQKQ